MRKDCCVVFHAYKHPLQYNENERKAIAQMIRVFPQRDIIFITTPELFEVYSKTYKTLVYDSKYFTYGGYNEMCKSAFFYQDFLDLGYKYMCLTQEDVWIFQDNLDYFLNIFDRDNLDYVGGPWYGVHFCRDGVVGNGGFCIRRLEKFRDICQEGVGGGNEDVAILMHKRSQLKIAPEKLALEFSWEEKPAFAYKLCEGKLPMGSHAYASCPDRITFWKQYISDIKEIKAIGGLMDIYNNPQHVVGENDDA